MERLLPIGSSARVINQQQGNESGIYALNYRLNLHSVSELEIPLPERLLRIKSEYEDPSKEICHKNQILEFSKKLDSINLVTSIQHSRCNNTNYSNDNLSNHLAPKDC
ncbi:PREDICTED: uncharacterized protein LOC105366980, partial [Ceratosolen solmsi marchali]|uniref:Uncharacterized protein LOC105366980 n=1 Tax=Ceratosolen solmsi marchali TaxID=326594 RepID=A0AAJ6YTB1_9HYME